MYKPYHAIGLELGISVAAVGLGGEPTGQAIAWHGDVVATAKRDLAAGEVLDGAVSPVASNSRARSRPMRRCVGTT